MQSFPLFIDMQNTRVVVVGGAAAATQKVRLLSRSIADITVMAATLTDELQTGVANGQWSHLPAILDPTAFRGARLVVIATGCPGLDAAAAHLAMQAGALVNVVDRPALSNATMPAIVDRDPVIVAIGTEGTAPVLARQIKTRIERMLEPTLGQFARRLGKLRPRVAQRIAPDARRGFWEWVMARQRTVFSAGDEAGAIAAIEGVLDRGTVPGDRRTPVALIDPACQSPDLLTIRAVERLQTADLIVHDPECPRGILDLGRRDADRFVAPSTDAPQIWTLRRAAQAALSAAAEGKAVVWLAGAEGQALLRADQVEVIPAVAVPSAVIARAEQG